ncbi:MAG: UDP-3-O-[3-hydroxymyristoyl] glucosamine N-acyltransferase [Cognaticolwellia sp.]|jgi:UDP-3-O-[3-hydroxymyristoyl] glucosamine N-acyltransferase
MNIPTISVIEIAEIIGAKLIGNPKLQATGLNEIHKVRAGDITFVDVEKYYKKSLTSEATIIIINKETDVPEGKVLLVCDNPYKAYNSLALRYRPQYRITKPISDSAIIGENCFFEPNVMIGEEVEIGKNCYLHANVVIYNNTKIGDNVEIHSGTVIGSPAFYYKGTPEGYERWHACGQVIIENNVEIGANCTIDKGVSGDTVIGAGTKLDNLVHLAHGVVVGKNCIIASQVGVAGKTIIEDNVTIYGQAGLSKSIRIGEKAVISAQAGVSKSLEGGKLYFGSPAEEARTKWRELAALRQLPEILRKMKRD